MLHITIVGPTDPRDYRTPYVVSAMCEHGLTSTPWRRTCGNGCHSDGPVRASHCRRVNPTLEQLRHLGVLGHGQRLACGCDEPYWMTEGPRHEWDQGGIQVDERCLTWPEREQLGDSMLGGPPVWTES